jgi:hypothetical protein
VDLVFPALTILAGNIVAGFVLALVKDLVNNVLWGETQLVLQKLAVNRNPARVEIPHVEINGRRAGLIGYLLALLDLSPKVSLLANAKEVRKSTMSLHGHDLEIIPLSESVSLQVESRRSLFWLVAAILSLTVGVAGGLMMGNAFEQKLFNGLSWVLASGIYLFAFYESHRLQIIVHGTLRMGVSFKPSVIEGRAIRFQEVLEVVETLMERIHESRVFGAAPGGIGPFSIPSREFDYPPKADPSSKEGEETLSEFPNPLASSSPAPAKKPEPPERSNTGTVEYGEDQPAFEAAPGLWSGGPEPGTSDSIQLRQSITRSATGMFLNVSGQGNDLDYADEELKDRDTDHNGATHRGTVSWEEHADKTQDEMRAEAELADLRRSRPRRGEAKLRLRELMRRFPQTEAALKARRMLERLESGG